MRRELACCFVLVAFAVRTAPVATPAECESLGTVPPQGAITSANAALFSQDALILAARVAVGPWLCATHAAGFEGDLRRIRAHFPKLTIVHATPEFVLNQTLITLDASTPWLAAWTTGTLQTGDAQVDELLGRFEAVAVHRVTVDPLTNNGVFVVNYGEPLNVPALVGAFRSATSYFRMVQPNYMLGGVHENQITFQQKSRRKRYTFSLPCGGRNGSGSGPVWKVTVSPGGAIRVARARPVPCFITRFGRARTLPNGDEPHNSSADNHRAGDLEDESPALHESGIGFRVPRHPCFAEPHEDNPNADGDFHDCLDHDVLSPGSGAG